MTDPENRYSWDVESADESLKAHVRSLKRLGITQAMIAKKLGIHTSRLSRWINGKGASLRLDVLDGLRTYLEEIKVAAQAPNVQKNVAEQDELAYSEKTLPLPAVAAHPTSGVPADAPLVVGSRLAAPRREDYRRIGDLDAVTAEVVDTLHAISAQLVDMAGKLRRAAGERAAKDRLSQSGSVRGPGRPGPPHPKKP